MPPGAWHEVYTPVNTVISDGHFLCYDVLHLTQWSRLYDHMDKYATNADHVGVRRTLARMAIALRYVDRTMPKRCFQALASFVSEEGRYRAADRDKDSIGARYEDDIEMVVAYRIVKVISELGSISMVDVHNESVWTGANWDMPGKETVRRG
ncbi:hypothetical protein BV25DRAFT_1922880 [Artomyces pyxidatus]|uniref:Uncharacterized protein n=1 Tax=Artomyces pyxidatus TaxID=48021 RepID=A0ACB8SCF6_9AGAM|nr:hypothetical protein BV25DRAFT_1922880 [Artomyces pyxidatus]